MLPLKVQMFCWSRNTASWAGLRQHQTCWPIAVFFQQGETPIKAVGGVADLVLDELCSLGLDCSPFCSPTTLNWIILLEPEAVKLALDRVLIKAGVDVLLHTRVAAVARTADRIQSVTLAGMDGRRRVAAEAFVDATGDANLAMLAGLECRVGNDHGHLQAISAPIRIGGRDLTVPIDRNAVIAGFETYNKIGKYPPLALTVAFSL